MVTTPTRKSAPPAVQLDAEPDVVFLGVWEGVRHDRSGLWLRWWDENNQMLLWGAELIEQERGRAERTQTKAVIKLKEMGLSAEQIAATLDLSVEQVRQQLEP